MDNLLINRHISGQFNAELESLRSHVLVMGGLVEKQFDDALKAMNQKDIELAQRVHRKDQRVNEMEVAIDEACTRIIAKRQPTASDLRLIMSIIKTVADLERIGDASVKIAKMASDQTIHQQQDMIVSLFHLGKLALSMLHQVLDAFARMDDKAAIELYQLDNQINKKHREVLGLLTDKMQANPALIPMLLTLVHSINDIERVGDRCQNICEYIIYFVTGNDVRHTGLKQLIE
ncbi:phosphate signaling complex protein PhoU [Vibrio sp. SS-MA-C1-2]|uniref:phosphate signaling complex protein PhoU n=1 Tax=Vibrio sp. SS-MA-C1-2 TaxID=2908646 RepID=UPI001F315D38|nr:phosphate signaling complex protein PhoU [Vibrio sp. SS-MA-C1-2]UJF18985.1 phosphate signaling complex protein PhoU [Vibrio sp. SS-MA-C1-2]